MQKRSDAPFSRPLGAAVNDAQNAMYDPLTDLLGRNTAAYEFFYSLSPELQEQLRERDIYTLPELHRAADELTIQRRPPVF